MEKISIKLTRKEWTGLTALVLAESSKLKSLEDRYYRALVEHLLKQTYIRLHNKLHSLNESKNTLTITLPEAAAFNMVFADEDYQASNSFSNAIIVSITSHIDKKLA